MRHRNDVTNFFYFQAPPLAKSWLRLCIESKRGFEGEGWQRARTVPQRLAIFGISYQNNPILGIFRLKFYLKTLFINVRLCT